VTVLSAARATQRPLACLTMILNINPRHTTKKTTSNPALMRIWARKAASMPLAISPAAAQAGNPTPP
jgi:hypothetical protein